MKNLALLFTIVFMFSVAVLSAHPASSVAAEFDKKENLLTITYNHQVKNASNHYIMDITVKKNKEVIITQKLSYQDSNEGGSLVYKINDLKTDDKLDISAKCNKFGTKSTSLKIK